MPLNEHRRVILLIPPFPETTLTSYGKVMKWLGKKAPETNLGIITAAALLPVNWDLRLLDLCFHEISDYDWNWADLIFITGMTIQEPEIVSLIQEGKRRAKTVVVGGPWAFHSHVRAMNEGADIVVQGEAEVATEAMLLRLRDNDLRRVVYADGRADLTSSPLPRWDLLDMNAYLAMPIQFSRGCPFHCEFCDITHMFGKTVRVKQADQILRELNTLYELGWVGEVNFVDDNLIGRPAQAIELFRHMIPWMQARRYPFEFQTQASLNLARNEELLELMARAGFTKVCIGIESLENETLKRTGKYQNINVDVSHACRKIMDAGIRVKATFVIGMDGEQPGVDDRLIRFVRAVGMPDALLQPLVAYPGTDLWNRLENEGRLLPDGHDNLGTPARLPNFIPIRPIGEIAQELVHFFEVAYERGFCIQMAFDEVARLGITEQGTGPRTPFRLQLRLIMAVIYHHGVLYASRWTFWKLLLVGAWQFPSRLYYFFSYVAFAEHHFEVREKVRREVASALADWQQPLHWKTPRVTETLKTE